MSHMKAFAEDVSVEMGHDGELTDDVLREANRRLLQETVRTNRKLRTTLRAIAGHDGSSMPIEVVSDPINPKPMLAGESWHFETRGGRRIWHPSAYSRVGWSNMRYCCSTRRIEVDADWLSRHLHLLVK